MKTWMALAGALCLWLYAQAAPANGLPAAEEPAQAVGMSQDLSPMPEAVQLPVAVEGESGMEAPSAAPAGEQADESHADHAEEGHAGAEAEHAGGHDSGGLPQLDPSTYPSQLFWLAVTFILTYVFLSKKILPDVSSVMEARSGHIRNDMETAETLRKNAEAAQRTYEETLGRARIEAAKAVAAVHARIQDGETRAGKDFAEKADHAIAATEARLEKARQGLMDEMSAIAAEAAREAAEKIVGISMDIGQARTVVKALHDREAA